MPAERSQGFALEPLDEIHDRADETSRTEEDRDMPAREPLQTRAVPLLMQFLHVRHGDQYVVQPGDDLYFVGRELRGEIHRRDDPPVLRELRFGDAHRVEVALEPPDERFVPRGRFESLRANGSAVDWPPARLLRPNGPTEHRAGWDCP